MTAVPRTRRDLLFLLILVLAMSLRLHLAASTGYIHDEDNTAIPLSQTISFNPGSLHLPLRGENHGALPAYLVKASSTLFGTSPLGYRAVHVLLSLCTIVLVYVLVGHWYGPVAALWSAALLAFNEYYLGVSTRATAHVPHLFFVAAAIFAFARFLAAERPVHLYAAGVAVGLAFYCKEHSVLLLPVFLATLLHGRYRRWLRGPHVYLACLMFVAVIGPDLYWNLRTDPDTARVQYGDQNVGQATYGNHLRRIGGLGLSPYPLMFYGRPAVRDLHARVTGVPLSDETPEYPSVNVGLGALLLGSVLITTIATSGQDAVRRFLLILFWGIFGLFTLIARGDPPGRLDPVSWIWVEVTLLPAVMLAGARLADAAGLWRLLAWTTGFAALFYALLGPLATFTGVGLGESRDILDLGSHTLQELSIRTVAVVRSHPLRAVGCALAAGLVLGLILGAALARDRRGERPQGEYRSIWS